MNIPHTCYVFPNEKTRCAICYQCLEVECDKLKAELERLSCPHCGSDTNGTNWKKLALAAKEIINNCIPLITYIECLVQEASLCIKTSVKQEPPHVGDITDILKRIGSNQGCQSEDNTKNSKLPDISIPLKSKLELCLPKLSSMEKLLSQINVNDVESNSLKDFYMGIIMTTQNLMQLNGFVHLAMDTFTGKTSLPAGGKETMTPHLCPVCAGRGKVPCGFYGIPMSSGTADEQCHTCLGQGVIWSKE